MNFMGYSLALNTDSFEDFAQNPWPIRGAVLVGIFILVSYLGYWLFVRTAVYELVQLRQKEHLLKKEFALKQQQLGHITLYRQQLAQTRAHFAEVLQQFSTINDLPQLLDDLSQTGMRLGLKFKRFDPQPAMKHDFYIEHPIRLTIVGTYMQLALFFSQTATMRRLITWHEFSLIRMSSQPVLMMKISATLYQLR